MRTPVNLEDQRIQTAGVEVLRLEQPAFDSPPVRCGELVALRMRDIAIAKPGIQVGQPGLGAIGDDMKLSGIAWVGGAERKDPRGDVEVEDPARAADLRPEVAIEVARVKPGDARSAGEKVKTAAVFGPADADAMAPAHVGDDAVADRLIEREGQAAWHSAARWHHPQPLDEAGLEAVGSHESDGVASRRPRWRAQVEPACNLGSLARQVDDIEVELTLQVGVRRGVSCNCEPGAVRRPVKTRGVPDAASQLLGLAALRRHHEQVVIAPIDETLTVMLVVEAARNPDYGRSP